MICAIVIGPESSGTRLLTDCFVRSGYFGSAEHQQPFDQWDFANRPEKIVYRQSVPHGEHWLRFDEFAPLIQAEGYRLKPIVIFRDQVYTALSQFKSNHSKSIDHAHEKIRLARHQIFEQCQTAQIVLYEPFVCLPDYRDRLFKLWGINPSGIDWQNANDKYRF